MRARRVVACALLVMGCLTEIASAGPPPAVRIVAPSGVESVFGQVPVSVEVETGEAVAEVELFVDSRRVAVITSPPYRFMAETGYENAEHSFRVVVHTVSGATGEAVVRTPSVKVDDEVTVALQQLYVTASEGEDRVLDLERGEFEIFDDGKRQKVITFERGDVPFTAVILLDASASMIGEKLRAALGGAGAFADGMQPLDEAKLVVFSDTLLAATPYLGPGAGMIGSASGVVARGGTALNDTLYVALKELEHRQGRRVIVVLSDGMDSHSVLAMDDVLPRAELSRALLYWVRLEKEGASEVDRDPGLQHSAWRDGKGHRRQVDLLGRVAERSGGRVTLVENPDRIVPRFEEVLQELREQYVLGYYPSTDRDDGRWHDIEVKVTRRGVKVRTAGGYFDN